MTLPQRLTTPKSVLVVGGGLAGLAAAYELSQRGFSVTLLERSSQCGGKIASWDVQACGRTFRVEHGFHGFFPHYYNLNAVLAEVNASSGFRPLNSYAVVYKNHYKPEVFRSNSLAFPWNIVDLALSSPNSLNWGVNLSSPEHWQVFREIAGFDTQSSFARLDHLSVSEWVEGDFPRGLSDLYFLPFTRSSLNAPDLLSSGELMQFFHFYFFGNPEGLAFSGALEDMGTCVVDPLVQRIHASGGQVLTQANVQRIGWENGCIRQVKVAFGTPSQQEPFWVAPLPAPGAYSNGEARFALRRDRRTAIGLTCTHQGCTVLPREDGTYRCPCHGATFDAQGRVLRGPAARDLPRYRVQAATADRLQLAAHAAEPSSSGKEEVLEPDYVIIAADVPGVKQLLRGSDGAVPASVRRQIDSLAIADPFAVARLWFDRDFPWDHSDFTSLSGYRLIDSIALYHRIQKEYIAWARETGGSVVELQAYCYKEEEFPDQDSLLAAFESELLEVVPELRGATLLHRELVNQKNFSGYPPNSHALRPGTCSEAGNLFFAGDWVKMPFPCGLMERAVSSGLLAANAILRREGIQRRPLLSVDPSGVLSPLARGPAQNV